MIQKVLDIMISRREKLYAMVSVIIQDDGHVIAEQLCCDCEYDEAQSYISISKECMGRPKEARLYMIDQEKVVAFLQKLAKKSGREINFHRQPMETDMDMVH